MLLINERDVSMKVRRQHARAPSEHQGKMTVIGKSRPSRFELRVVGSTAAAGEHAPVGGWADFLLGDAAGEMQVPLAQLKASLRALMRSDSEALGPRRLACLEEAFAACRRLDEMTLQMRRLHRRRQGCRGTVRSWFDSVLLCEDALRSVADAAAECGVTVVHSLPAEPAQVYGDPVQASLLLSSLLEATVRRTSRGGRVLVRVSPSRTGQTLQLSVVDGAPAPAANDVGDPRSRVEHALRRQWADRLFTDLVSDGDGVRSLSELGFELPAAGPRSVAVQWAKWRCRYIAAAGGSEQNSPALGPLHPEAATLVSVAVGGAVGPQALDRFQSRLQDDLGLFELAYRTAPRQWVLIWDATPAEAQVRLDDVITAASGSESRLRIQCSPFSRLTIAPAITANALADRLARECLQESGRLERDESATGGRPFVASGDAEIRCDSSAIPHERLDAEMRHLAERLSQQSNVLRGQAAALRSRPAS